ncbi:MAG: 16S rRNA processing protein RimM [Candidatus Aminicenantes bacterium]|nr:16S rRNA processing protein RimM [Candidatus Aminicenantes bacterium]
MLNLLLNIFFSWIYVEIGGEFRKFWVEHLLPRGDSYLLKLKGINTIAEAGSLKGRSVFLPEEALRFLAEDEYFVYQLVGCLVITQQGQTVGQVKDIWFIPGNELLIVASGKPGKEILIPFHQNICRKVDLKAKEIIIDPPEGLLEIDEI